MGLSRNDSQAFAPDGAIVFVTSTLNCNLVMCQAEESIIHSISAGERRLKVQDMPQVIKVVKIRRYTMGEKKMPFFFFFHTQFIPKNLFKQKKSQDAGKPQFSIVMQKLPFYWNSLNPFATSFTFFLEKNRKASLKICQQVTGLEKLTLFLTHCDIHFNYHILVSNSDFKLYFSCIPQITSSSALVRFHFSVM